MTLEEQRQHTTQFFAKAHSRFTDNGLNIVVLKGSDYAPERIPMVEAFFTAAELDVDVPHILWVHVRKHTSAISQWMATGTLKSEDLRSRLMDVANYMALIDSYIADPVEWLKMLGMLIDTTEFKFKDEHEVRILRAWVDRTLTRYRAVSEWDGRADYHHGQ